MKRFIVFSVVVILAAAAPSFAGALLNNGSGVRLGVNDQGHLNYSGAGTPANASAYGVAFDFGEGVYYDATAPGCLCEGWGVAVNGATSGWASIANGGVSGVTLSSFASTSDTATSVVALSALPGITVTHAYAPSSSSSLFEATVTIANTTGADVTNVTYRRAMDWDVPPTEFNEFVKIAGLPAANLLYSSDNGFAIVDPLSPASSIDPASVNANYFGGPYDHGAVFDFGFGTLGAGQSVTFKIFYGAGFGESTILSALGSVGAEVYSLGYSTLATGGGANTSGVVYGFGFAGVGGTPIEPVPEPGTLLLLGSGVAALAARRRRKA